MQRQRHRGHPYPNHRPPAILMKRRRRPQLQCQLRHSLLKKHPHPAIHLKERPPGCKQWCHFPYRVIWANWSNLQAEGRASRSLQRANQGGTISDQSRGQEEACRHQRDSLCPDNGPKDEAGDQLCKLSATEDPNITTYCFGR